MLSDERTFTPSEAAVVSGVAVKTVHREIDEGPLKLKRKRSPGKRSLREGDLFYLAVAKSFDARLVQLTSGGKGKLRHAILAYWRSGKPARKEFPLFGGDLSLDLKRVFSEVWSRLELLEHAQKMVVEDPEVRGGEPCIQGTRIGVYEVAGMLEKGTSEEELLEGYPSLKRRHLELAKIFAQAYPRRGRPPRHPWHRSPWRQISPGETRT
jgi:uncharacterized protein (DUF433 family)